MMTDVEKAKEFVKEGLATTGFFFKTVVEQHPDDKLEVNGGGKSKNPLEICSHIIGGEIGVIKFITSGNTQDFFAEVDVPTLKTKADILKVYEETRAKTLAAIDQFTPEQLLIEHEFPWGKEKALEMLIWLPSHQAHHIGQIDYIQTILEFMEGY